MNAVLSEPLPSTDRLLFTGDTVVIGQVRCLPTDPLFRNCGRTRTYCALFPRSAVLIRRRDRQPFVEDPTVVGLYNRGEECERFKVSPEGDGGDWFAFAHAVIRDAIRVVHPAAADSAHPLRVGWARTSTVTFLRQRVIYEHVRGTSSADAVLVEEHCIQLLDAIVAEAYGGHRPPADSGRAREIAETVSAIVDRRFACALTLQSIAAEVETSVFHVCRIFRRVYGTAIHRYLTDVRLRRALEAVGRQHVDLGQVALDAGFSSHSHFTAAFRRAFGIPPSRYQGYRLTSDLSAIHALVRCLPKEPMSRSTCCKARSTC